MDATTTTTVRAGGPPRRGGLGPAHRGYAYQDLVTAYLLIRCLVSRYEAVVVDRKAVDDDRFDDIEVTSPGTRIRRQLKSSVIPGSTLSESDFSAGKSSLRFDRLVRTFTSQGVHAADEYRLCATWQPSASSDPLASLLLPSDATGTFDGFPTQRFRLDVDRIWPATGDPIFRPLQEAPDGTTALTRYEVISFCERFVVEMALPLASLDLDEPGPLERLLLALLREQVGIGRYPNAARRVEDVAALAIYIASNARTAGATLTAADIAQRLGLRTDFGRVAQAFPLDKSVLQERVDLRTTLRRAIDERGVHLVLGGPGSGKSWALTQLAEDLQREGMLVARHYCFLEPGDELVERRVTTGVFFGNLLGELSDAFKARSYTPPQVFAAGINELETFLTHAADDGYDLIVIVDGVDHIARVVSASKSLRDDETDIIERLATLNIPEHVTLVIGSQPGSHLDPLREAFAGRIATHVVEPWSTEEIRGLVNKHGVGAALDEVHLLEDDRRNAIVELLAQRSEGNPLYTRYLSRGLVNGLLTGQITDPFEWLQATPPILGDIARYYDFLYRSASTQAKAFADILGVLDFAVTDAELREIVGPAFEGWLPDALRVLSPVLTRATAQGGLRIFHESFRRFMLLELERQGRRLSNVLAPVVDWLDRRNFLADAKSYRFLLPAMRRAGRESEIVQRVARSFVRDSLAHGHAHDAIERNLALAADVSARCLDWAALVRLSELSRALSTCFDVGTNNWQEYWQTYKAIYGPEQLAERLLFDGRPTLSRTEGLLACELVDTAGATAPWQEYLALPFPQRDDRYSPEFDSGGPLQEDEELGLAIVRGRLRLGQRLRVVRRVCAHLLHPDAEITSLFLRKLGRLLAEEITPAFVQRLATRADFGVPRRYSLPPPFACALVLGLADSALAAGDGDSAIGHATSALRHATTAEEAVWCIERGAPATLALAHAKPLSTFDLGLQGDHHILSAPAVREWLAAVRLHARSASPSTCFGEQRQRAEGAGWYRCWLRFVLATAEAESAASDNKPYDISAAFTELVGDTRPFEGAPRACDLYSIHSLINESLTRALTLVRSRDEWEHAIDCISRARDGTATRLDREDGGPITAGAFFSLLLPHASTPAADLIVGALEREVVDEEASGTYYSNHAEFRMRLARLHAFRHNMERARAHWREATTFLLGYGFHKDIALFDVLDNVPTLSRCSEETALSALMRLQPLLSAVLRHTDRRETKHAPNAWFRSLLEVNAVRAIELLCREFARELGAEPWIDERAQKDLLRRLINVADPMLLDALWETLLTEIEYESDGPEVAEDRLAPLKRILATRPEYASERFARLCSEVLNDARRYRESAVARLRAFAEEHRLSFPAKPGPEEKKAQSKASSGDESRGGMVRAERPPKLPPSTQFVDILTTIRKMSQERFTSDQLRSGVMLPLSYIMTEMLDRGDEVNARRLLRFIVHETSLWSFERAHPVATLAEFLDNAGHDELAAIAHTLAFTSSRGGGGWLNFGDRTQGTVLHRAMHLDKDLALQTLADETARKLRMGGFSGITKHLAEQISDWGDHALAAAAWDEAFAVMADRLPLPGHIGPLEPLDAQDVDWSVDEALATLLLVRVGIAVLPRKIAALYGFARLLEERPRLFYKPLQWVLTRDITVSTSQAVLLALLETPADVTQLLQSLEELLERYARGDAWTLSVLAEKLLARAGRPLAVTRSRIVTLDGSPSHRALVLTRYGDIDEVLESLRELWPDLPAIVATRIGRRTVDNDAYKHYARERMELATGRSHDAMPPAPVLSWPTELFIAVLDEALMGLHEHLWRRGNWDFEAENSVAGMLLPNLQLHLALAASRVARPPWPLPSEEEDHITDVAKVPSEDTQYGGWIRLALHEQQFYQSEGRDYAPADRIAVRSAAMVRAEMDGTIPRRAAALAEGEVDYWREDIHIHEASLDASLPQMVKLATTRDSLGSALALVPPLALRYRAKLKPPSYAAPLRWYDENGRAVLVLRTWRVRGDRITDIEAHSIIGADLLMRPDYLETLLTVYGGPLKDLQVVHTRSK